MTTEHKTDEAISEYVAACWMRGNEIKPGTEVEFDHCFGDESTDARNPTDSWTRLRAEVTEGHMRRAYWICQRYGYNLCTLVNRPNGDPAETASLYERMVAEPAARRVVADLLHA
jgi:hypothetical protein